MSCIFVDYPGHAPVVIHPEARIETITGLQKRIEDQTGVPPNAQHLVWRGHSLSAHVAGSFGSFGEPTRQGLGFPTQGTEFVQMTLGGLLGGGKKGKKKGGKCKDESKVHYSQWCLSPTTR